MRKIIELGMMGFAFGAVIFALLVLIFGVESNLTGGFIIASLGSAVGAILLAHA